MDFVTSTLLSGIIYDGFKHGVGITAEFLKEKLQRWVIDDSLLDKLSNKINDLNLEDFSENVIERKLNESSEIQGVLSLIQPCQNNIGTVTQNHSGSGDNIVGNKIIHNK
ncbi:TPA: hypothetical protein JD893_23420 [Citrobacter freundii]|jgi:hypothetical protein|nr:MULTISPECIES: hypothetical protein [Citrobacter]EKX5705281.1 hypothetical protein [Citrobacter freundii]EKY0068595.1 hypothetical protein [Citrobacter freundii]EKY0340642.1 hypothetical protein [Citrobacter freundii]MDE9636347.1 hypothetical protein [Citrobacter freundii]MDH0217254.1 hypothetical protein [Citrobacter freundii]